MSSGDSGSKYSAASPHTSGSEVAFEHGHRAAARHRLEGRQPEALVQAREDEAGGAAVQVDELFRRDVAARLHPFGQLGAFMSLPGQDEPKLRPLSPHAHECREQALVVLVRPAVGGIEKKRSALASRPGVNRAWSMPR